MNNEEPQDDEQKSQCPFPIEIIDVEIGEPIVLMPDGYQFIDWSKIVM